MRNLVKRAIRGVEEATWELPLTTVQDYSLFHILVDYSIDLWKRQIELIMEKHGLMSFIVHPDYVIADGALAVYKALLGHLSSLRKERKITSVAGGLRSEGVLQRQLDQARSHRSLVDNAE